MVVSPAQNGLENGFPLRGTEGSNPVPSSEESCKPSVPAGVSPAVGRTVSDQIRTVTIAPVGLEDLLISTRSPVARRKA
jgi:hypothetical protein